MNALDFLLLGLVGLALLLALRAWLRSSPAFARRRQASTPPGRIHPCFRPKPPWVRKEVIRLKALIPKAGCRTMALTFNRLHAVPKRMTIGKSYVAEVLRSSQEEVMRARRNLRQRRPQATGKNRTWALDLTYVGTSTGLRPLLGVIDHGTRACLALQELDRKTTVAVLRVVLDLIERFGRPVTLRTDNEATFTSKLFGLALWFLGIRHQRTDPFAPWQNGRIERFFGTFEQCLRELRAARPSAGEEVPDLPLFRLWYNHFRPHQNLQGLTPAEVWKGEQARAGKPRWFQAWSGVLSGFYVPN